MNMPRFSPEDLNSKDLRNIQRLGITREEYIARKQRQQDWGWKGLGTGVLLLAASNPAVVHTAQAVGHGAQAVYDKWNYEPSAHDTNKTQIEVQLDHDPKQSQIIVHTPAEQAATHKQAN